MNKTESQTALDARTARHGRGRYVLGCRCEICCAANRGYQRDYLRTRVASGIVNHHGKTQMTRILHENIRRLLTPEQRREIGQAYHRGIQGKGVARLERELQSQIVQDLRRRGFTVCWHRTDRKSHATIGWPDINLLSLTVGLSLTKLKRPQVVYYQNKKR